MPQDIAQLKQELQQKDLLVQQLSEELFRLVKGNVAFTPTKEVSEQHQTELLELRKKLATVEQQLAATHTRLHDRDQEIVALRQKVEELSDRNKALDKAVEELPVMYRNKFAERMVPIKAKVEMLQKENRQLHMELQSLSYRLASRVRPQKSNCQRLLSQHYQFSRLLELLQKSSILRPIFLSKIQSHRDFGVYPRSLLMLYNLQINKSHRC
jgi:chromosome segregation ATPase